MDIDIELELLLPHRPCQLVDSLEYQGKRDRLKELCNQCFKENNMSCLEGLPSKKAIMRARNARGQFQEGDRPPMKRHMRVTDDEYNLIKQMRKEKVDPEQVRKDYFLE